MQGDEAELSGMGRRAHDDHATRLEQRAERFVGRAHRGFGSGCDGLALDLDERVDRDRPALDDDQGIEVDRPDVGALLGETREAAERRDDGVAIDGGLAAERTEEGLGGEIVDQLTGIEPVEWYQAERDVAERLGQHTAHAEHDTRTELRVAYEPRDQLARTVHHRCDEQTDRAVLGAGGGEQFGRRGADGGGVGETEAHESAFRLVCDRVAAELDHDGIADRRRGIDRRAGVLDRALVEHRDAVAGEEMFRRGFREGRHGGRG